MLYLYVFLGVAFALIFYIWAFVFLHGSSPGTDSKNDAFINKTCSPTKGIFATVWTWGYFLNGWRRFSQFYRLVFFPRPMAKLGKRAVDATVYTVKDGEEKSLLRDYVDKMPKGMPLILNIGSYT